MKTKLTLIITMVCVAALSSITDAQNRRAGRSAGMSIDTDKLVMSCGDLHVTYDRRPALTEETQVTLPASQTSALQAQTANSGIFVTGWDRNEYSVTTCKAVPDDANASATLRDITTNIANGQIAVNGPNDREWTANLIIMVPRISNLNFRTNNGPLQLRDLAGSIQLAATNGPIGLDNVGGVVQATTSNGPISVKNSTGDQQLTASNGPISVALSGNHWDGPGLQASTHNGPMSISIPDIYGSGIQIQTSEHSPLNCTGSICAGATRSLGSPTVIRFGNATPTVRLSTMNGPVSIRAGRN